jgi:LysM repeat protein
MYKAKKESRSAGTETAMLEEVFRLDKTPHKNYITIFFKKQVFWVIIATVILLFLTIKVMSNVKVEFIPVEHKVTYGDTLWSIAEEYKPEDMTMDTYMAWVYDHNECGMIYPGDTVIMAEVVK